MLRLKETVNLDALKLLVLRVDDTSIIVKEERKKFIDYAERVHATGYTYVRYAPASHGKGRVYADKALSMQGFSCLIRESLAYGLYHDIDMKNCHPVFLLQLCEKHGWSAQCTHLRYYINNREEVLHSIPGCTRSEAKTVMLSLMYGGHAGNVTLPPFVQGYAQELGIIAMLVAGQYTNYHTANSLNPIFSRMSLVIQDIEHKVLMVMSTYLNEQGYTPGVYMYDGLMVYRKVPGSTTPFDANVLIECQAHVYRTLGYRIVLEEKPIEKGINK